MIGSGLKKLAKEHGMNVDKGVAYGSLGGFNATLSEGMGYKRITFATAINDPVQRMQLQNTLNGRNLERDFRVSQVAMGDKQIQLVFNDTTGTMKKIREFLDWFLPLLVTYGATGANICPECGGEVTGGCWKRIDGTAFYLHRTCAEKVCREIEASDTGRREEAGGNYFTGLIGALLGSAVGAVLWAVVMYFGYVASLVGLAIGWLAEKGYNLLKGRQGKGKIVILILAVILGVLLGNFGSDAIYLVEMINDGSIEGLTYGDIPALILLNLLDNPEYAAATFRYVLMGLFFAALGVWSLLRRAGAEVADTNVVDLK